MLVLKKHHWLDHLTPLSGPFTRTWVWSSPWVPGGVLGPPGTQGEGDSALPGFLSEKSPDTLHFPPRFQRTEPPAKARPRWAGPGSLTTHSSVHSGNAHCGPYEPDTGLGTSAGSRNWSSGLKAGQASHGRRLTVDRVMLAVLGADKAEALRR